MGQASERFATASCVGTGRTSVLASWELGGDGAAQIALKRQAPSGVRVAFCVFCETFSAPFGSSSAPSFVCI